jgi:hypothetical protein
MIRGIHILRIIICACADEVNTSRENPYHLFADRGSLLLHDKAIKVNGLVVEHVPHLAPSAPAPTCTPVPSAVAVEGRHPHQTGGLPTADPARLGQQRHRREGGDRAHAGHGQQQVVLPAPLIRAQQLQDALLNLLHLTLGAVGGPQNLDGKN